MVVAYKDLGFLFCCSNGLTVISCWENQIYNVILGALVLSVTRKDILGF